MTIQSLSTLNKYQKFYTVIQFQTKYKIQLTKNYLKLLNRYFCFVIQSYSYLIIFYKSVNNILFQIDVSLHHRQESMI